MMLRSQGAVVPNEAYSTPPETYVLHVTMAYGNGGWQNFHFPHCKCLPYKPLSCAAVVYIEMPLRSDVKVCTCSPVTIKEYSGTLRP